MDGENRSYTPEQMSAEKRLRVRLTLAAYNYEMMNGAIETLMSDNEFDFLCTKVDLECPTGDNKLDRWWKDNFDPSTGQWIWQHPEHSKIAMAWYRLRNG